MANVSPKKWWALVLVPAGLGVPGGRDGISSRHPICNFCTSDVSCQELKDELKGLVALVDPSEDSEDNSERSEAALKISAIYGKGAENKSYEELCRMKPIISIPPSRCTIFRETTVSSPCISWSPRIAL